MNWGLQVKGVNLGGWFVLERWLTPSLFAGMRAVDEYSFCAEAGSQAQQILYEHWSTFITSDDFQWISQHGLNAVRIPLGYWLFGGEFPYVESVAFLDSAMDMAGRAGLGVVLDLHGAPGSQNGEHHSGRAQQIAWTTGDSIERSLAVLGRLAQRYRACAHLIGIELLNEPSPTIPLEVLKHYYHDGYSTVRQHCTKEQVAVIIHDAWQPYAWGSFLKEPLYSNVIIDTHLYQCFDEHYRSLDIAGHIEKAAVTWKDHLELMNTQLWVYVGEWSLALDGRSLEGFSPFEREGANRAYAEAQLRAFEHAQGWFFWTYKTEESQEWSFRFAVERGWLPEYFG